MKAFLRLESSVDEECVVQHAKSVPSEVQLANLAKKRENVIVVNMFREMLFMDGRI